MSLFSKRLGYAEAPKIKVRGELPIQLRKPIVNILSRYIPSAFLEERVGELLNPYGIDSVPVYSGPLAISKEEDKPQITAVTRILLGCEWFHVLDIIEDVYGQLTFYEDEVASPDKGTQSLPLQRDINDYFTHAGIGWQMSGGKILARQDEAVEFGITTGISELYTGNRPTAARHIELAIRALSERPLPNTSGAVSHATNSIECVLGDITGESLTLGKYLDRFPDLFHPALKKSLDGLYGFASNAGARHGKEGVEPRIEEANFTVAICAAVCAFLNAAHPNKPQIAKP